MTPKRALLEAIEHLPEHHLIEVLRYVETLSEPTAEEHASDPLSEFIGAVEHGSLASTIDPELYG